MAIQVWRGAARRTCIALHLPSAWRSRRANTACSFFPPSGNCASSWGYGHVRYRWHIFLEDFTEILLSLISNESGHMMISNWSFFLDLYLSGVGPGHSFLTEGLSVLSAALPIWAQWAMYPVESGLGRQSYTFFERFFSPTSNI